MTQERAIGIDIGGTHVKFGCVDAQGAVRARRIELLGSPPTLDDLVEKLAAAVESLMAEHAMDRSALAGVGVGCPGPLSPSRGNIHRAANIPLLVDAPLRQRLADRLKLAVVLENDGNAAAYGEYRFGVGAAADETPLPSWGRGQGEGVCNRATNAATESGPADRRGDLVMLTLGTGVGGGVILDGRILHGHHENAGELGHMIVIPGGRPCPCGQRGCLEQYASARAVAQRVEDAIEAGQDSVLAEQQRCHVPIAAEDVLRAANMGDPLCRRVWSQLCQMLAVACVNLEHVYNPRWIVLGGGLALAGDALLNPVRRAFVSRRWRLTDAAPAIELARLGYDAGLIGAAALALA